ncbi:MAG: cysteine protease StiP family protein [Deltaproteobacteria bacterium]|jgi:hypothetical protein|nr:cysteine protease StiP family protein [Deltaproteobacteria bacterium]
MIGFSGSYAPDDVVFLLKTIDLAPTALSERERLIQTGQAHYSEMIGPEDPPSPRYLEVFHQAVEENGPALARLLADLAAVVAARPGPLTLVSLARAGTPVGVLLKRTLERFFGRPARHYSVSIIRDRGLDENALDHILGAANRPDSSVIFVDGWTGKGVIARELASAAERYNRSRGTRVSPALHVLTDLCGEAGISPSCDDVLIPSSILNSTVSGLVSRTILNRAYLAPGDFHGCLHHRHLEPHDLSRWYVERIMTEVERLDARSPLTERRAAPLSPERRERLRRDSRAFVERLAATHGPAFVNHVKPGIGEATRTLLRRAPEVLYLKNPGAPDVRHLEILAEEKKTPVIRDPDLPCQAAAVIKNLENA